MIEIKNVLIENVTVEVKNNVNTVNAVLKFDGCVDLYIAKDGEIIKDIQDNNITYLHICNIVELIDNLKEVIDTPIECYKNGIYKSTNDYDSEEYSLTLEGVFTYRAVWNGDTFNNYSEENYDEYTTNNLPVLIKNLEEILDFGRQYFKNREAW